MRSYLCAGENGSVHCSALLPFALDGEGLKPEPVSAQEPAEIKVERFRMQQRSCYRNKAEQTNTQSSLLSPSTYFILTIGNEWLFHQCDSRLCDSAEALSLGLFSKQNMPHHFCLVPYHL